MPPPPLKHAFGWNCKSCTMFHHAPAARCSMCGELRGASRKEMHDFVLGKRVAPVLQGNCVELLDSPEQKAPPNNNHNGKKNNHIGNKNDVVQEKQNNASNHPNASKENRHNHKAPPSLPKPMAQKAPTVNPYFKPGGAKMKNNPNSSVNSNKPGAVWNPYFKGRNQPQPNQQPQRQQRQLQEHENHSVARMQQQPSRETQKPPSNTNHGDNEKENRTEIALQPPQQQQHSFFDKAKRTAAANKAKARGRKSTVHRFGFTPGPVPHDPQKTLTYIYPKHPDYPTRDYQLEITETALNYNTLVSLPTGLGKTHIAAVVMYNYFRWFTRHNSATSGKIIFLAPTLPLVHQQIEACYNIMGIPGNETAVLTGRIKACERKELWKSKRVFYCTPQTVQKDLLGACGSGDNANDAAANVEDDHDPETALAFSRVVCLVLDEAHKATGDYAYTRVVHLLEKAAGAKFRIVGLSATPGTSIKNIQGVIDVLRSCKIEARTDTDPSVAPYLHTKLTEVVICHRNTAQKEVSRKLSRIIHPYLEQLRKEGGLQAHGNDTMTAYTVFRAKQTYEARMGARKNGGLVSCFNAVHQIVQIRNDCNQGLGVVKTKLLRLKNNPQRGILSTVRKSDGFNDVLQMVLDVTSGNSSCEDVVDPKLAKLCELLKHHFERNNACNNSSRAIVFAQFRDNVKEIVNCLESNLKPLVRSRYFVGQNKGASGGSKDGDGSKHNEQVHGMKQAEQQKAIKDFKNNVFNVLVCTSIGEEGLDIGDVDLIVNFDVISSPIRTIQRAGRTGRKRDGRVVSLIAEGAELENHKKRLNREKTLRNALKDPRKFFMGSHYPMLPHAPEKEYKIMEIQSKLSLKEVAGAQHTPAASKAEKKKNSWRLDASEEYERENLCGNLVSLSDEKVTWERLKSFFCKNRVDPTKLQGIRKTKRLLLSSLGKEDRRRLLKARNTIRQNRGGNRRTGRIEGILESIQKYGPLHFEGTTRSGYRDILSIFPVDPVNETQKPNSTRVSKKLWENSTSRNDKKQLPITSTALATPFALDTRSGSNAVNTAADPPKALPGRETAQNKLISGSLANPSHMGSTAVGTALIPDGDSNCDGRPSMEAEKVKNCVVVSMPSSDALQKPPPEAAAFRLATPPPSSDDDSSVAPDMEENIGFRLPTQSSSSDSSSDEDENMGDDVDSNPIPESIVGTEFPSNKENNISAPDQKYFEIQAPILDPPESTNDKLIFRFPTPPPSSSSSGSEEEDNDDSDTITVPEPKPIGETSSGDPDRNGQDICAEDLNECKAQDFPVSNHLSPSNGCVDSNVINLEGERFRQTETKAIADSNSIPACNTPRQKLSYGFDGENDIALSSLKSRSSSKSKKTKLNEVDNDIDDIEEDVPLITFRNKDKTPNSSKKKLLDDFSRVTQRKKRIPPKDGSASEKKLPSGVSFGKSPWKNNGGGYESEEDTPLILFSNKKKVKSQHMADDTPLIDFCEKKNTSPHLLKSNNGSDMQGISLFSSRKTELSETGQERKTDIKVGEKENLKTGAGKRKCPPALETICSTNTHLNQNSTLESIQTSSQDQATNRSKRGEKNTKRLRILETPDSKSAHLSADLPSTQKQSQNEILDHSARCKNRPICPRILDTPDSTSANLYVDLTSTSKKKPSNEIIDHPKTAKPYKRMRIGSEDSENEDAEIGTSIGVEDTPRSYSESTPPIATYQLAVSALEDTPQISARMESSGMKKENASDSLTDTPIATAFKNVAKNIVCEVCASGDSIIANPLVLCDACNLGFHKNCYGINIDIESEEPWFCDSCIASSARKNNPNHKSSPRPKKLQKKTAKTSSKSSKPASGDSKEMTFGEVIHLDDTDNEESPRSKKQRLRERRRQGLAKFVLDEAEIGSDQERDDANEEEEVRRIEEEEAYSHDSFINDSAILTQHFSQDILGEIDPDASSVGGSLNGTPGINQSSHRALDAKRERENQFKTPNFNRRMMRATSGSSSTPSSTRGLGNMNFIRSVLEHHRSGGDCDQIEAEYKRIEASSTAAAAATERNAWSEATPTTLATNLNRDDDCIDLTTPPENNGVSSTTRDSTTTRTSLSNDYDRMSGSGTSNRNGIRSQPPSHHRPPPQNGGLTTEQLARIEANRQAALRRRAELLVKKQQNHQAQR